MCSFSTNLPTFHWRQPCHPASETCISFRSHSYNGSKEGRACSSRNAWRPLLSSSSVHKGRSASGTAPCPCTTWEIKNFKSGCAPHSQKFLGPGPVVLDAEQHGPHRISHGAAAPPPLEPQNDMMYACHLARCWGEQQCIKLLLSAGCEAACTQQPHLIEADAVR